MEDPTKRSVGRPIEPWSDAMIQYTRALIDAGLSARQVCLILEDEFGTPCSEETLLIQMHRHGIVWPGRIGRRAA